MKKFSIQKIEDPRGEYDPATTDTSGFDELQARESLDESEKPEDNTVLNKYYPKDSVNVLDESANDSCKPKANLITISRKQAIISELNKCTYKTPPIAISNLLEQLFIDYPSRDTHWPFIAQTYSPRTINRVLVRMKKYRKSGGKILNPAALFTDLIQFRKKRKTSNLFTPEELRIKKLRKEQGNKKQKENYY